jgi:hypothetical protein
MSQIVNTRLGTIKTALLGGTVKRKLGALLESCAELRLGPGEKWPRLTKLYNYCRLFDVEGLVTLLLSPFASEPLVPVLEPPMPVPVRAPVAELTPVGLPELVMLAEPFDPVPELEPFVPMEPLVPDEPLVPFEPVIPLDPLMPLDPLIPDEPPLDGSPAAPASAEPPPAPPVELAPEPPPAPPPEPPPPWANATPEKASMSAATELTTRVAFIDNSMVGTNINGASRPAFRVGTAKKQCQRETDIW